MNRLEGGNASNRGVDKFKGFVGTPEYKARQAGIDQIKQSTPKELGGLGNSLKPAQGEPSNRVESTPKLSQGSGGLESLFREFEKSPEHRAMMEEFKRMAELPPDRLLEKLRREEPELLKEQAEPLKKEESTVFEEFEGSPEHEAMIKEFNLMANMPPDELISYLKKKEPDLFDEEQGKTDM
jgi:hypothetical protein